MLNFAADRVEYDEANDVITAVGDVLVVRNGYRLRAGRVAWDRKAGTVTASGQASVTDPAGDTVYGDSVTMNEALKDGVI
ncbi:MAG: LPS-assembly protein LptD, partial [Alphaproteobacteria bacterium]|nr:LPS-assembly protein LptD [Alphaproteobacteria bacterium]